MLFCVTATKRISPLGVCDETRLELGANTSAKLIAQVSQPLSGSDYAILFRVQTHTAPVAGILELGCLLRSLYASGIPIPECGSWELYLQELAVAAWLKFPLSPEVVPNLIWAVPRFAREIMESRLFGAAEILTGEATAQTGPGVHLYRTFRSTAESSTAPSVTIGSTPRSGNVSVIELWATM